MTKTNAAAAQDDRHGKTQTLASTDSGFPEGLSVAVKTDPAPLVASIPGQEPAWAALHVLLTNALKDGPVAAHSISIALRVANGGEPQADLLSERWAEHGAASTRQSQSRSVSNPQDGAYTFTYTGTENGAPFKPGESIELFIPQIPVSAKEGATVVLVGVKARQSDHYSWRTIPLGKFPAGYYLRELRADTDPVAYGAETSLTWLAPPLRNIEYELYANGKNVVIDQDHPQPVKTGPLTTDTTFELIPSWSTDVRHKQRVLVRVMDGDISAKDADLQTTTTASLEVKGSSPNYFSLDTEITDILRHTSYTLARVNWKVAGNYKDYFGRLTIPESAIKTNGLIIGNAHLHEDTFPDARLCIWGNQTTGWNGTTVPGIEYGKGPVMSSFIIPVAPGVETWLGIQARSGGFYNWLVDFQWLPFGNAGEIPGSPFTFTQTEKPEHFIWG